MGMPVDAENDEKSALVKEDLDSSSDDEESEEEVEEESKSIEILRSAWEEQCQIGGENFFFFFEMEKNEIFFFKNFE